MSAWLIAVIVVSCLIFLVGLWFFSGYIAFLLTLRKGSLAGKIINRTMQKNIESYKIDYQWWDKQKIEKLFLKTEEETLVGNLIRNGNSKKIAIVVHGIFGTHKDLAPQAKILFENGFNILAPDLRAHGETTGKNISMGCFEKDDLVLWINKLVEVFGKDCQIVLLGISMGGATVLLTSGENLPKNVKCVVSDSGYSNAYLELKSVVNKALVPSFIILPQLNFFLKKLSNFDLKQASPIDAVKTTSLPILFIHGNKDSFVPCKMSKEMFEVSNKEICEFQIFEGAIHIQSFATNENLYEKILLSFVDKWVC